MNGELFLMNQREINRLEVIAQLISKQLKQKDAAVLLGISLRHVKRLLAAFKRDGAKALVSARRGKPSNHQCVKGLKQQALDIIIETYSDFGPTLAQEYLEEHDNIKLSVETIRQLMVGAQLWKIKHDRRSNVVHQQRERRARFGELVQLDGSTHDWFEGRADTCCLHVLIDDATGALVGLHFDKSESTFGYFCAMEPYFIKYGIPMALYSDKHGIFRVNIKDAVTGDGHTQFSRAIAQLNIEIIYANTPQAKGRVERANSTLQDRLIKAMRLQKINSIEEANIFLPQFMEDFNRRFAHHPKNEANAHRELTFDKEALANILCRQTYRTLSKNLECSHDNVIYQIKAQDRKRRLQNKKVKICEHRSGEVTIFYDNQKLSFTRLDSSLKKTDIVADDKTINRIVDDIVIKQQKINKPAANHPWRYFGGNKKTKLRYRA